MAYVKPEEIVENMLLAGAKKAGLPVKHLLMRGFLAGAFLGYATTLAILAATQTGWGMAGALVFPVGFVMIILLGLELVTGNFALIPIAVKDKRTPFSRLIVSGLGIDWQPDRQCRVCFFICDCRNQNGID
jgi:formate/nitrite transporter FocA (FNT family)